MQLPPPDCLNIQEREETELGVGNALLHVSRYVLNASGHIAFFRVPAHSVLFPVGPSCEWLTFTSMIPLPSTRITA